ncbi:hypothetical protein, partial [Victivallis vadensis]|uniref:hypothetical protein n=1 Tax=Victivallis vadensis TaxID=172901 RepID=UPI0023F96950
ENHIETVCKRYSMGGILAKTYGDYRQRRHRRWKLQVCFTKFGTITVRYISLKILDIFLEKRGKYR